MARDDAPETLAATLGAIPSSLVGRGCETSRALAALQSAKTERAEPSPELAATALAARTLEERREAMDAAAVPPARYEYAGLVGEGGMGRVECFRDRDLLRDVAVKHLRAELASDRRALGHFLWEARVTAHLDHPNIVPIHDVGSGADGEPFYTMKLVRGATLESVVTAARNGREDATLPRRLRMFLQVCAAVSFAHARGVLHRDLKPANVMVGEHGEVAVTDWGLAMPLEGVASAALAGAAPEGLGAEASGTPLYMSPEQARADALDERSDVYSLGVMLYELVALRSAFDAASVPELLTKVQQGESVALADACPGVSASLAAVVQKAMAVDRAARYSTVGALANDIEAVMDGLTPVAESISLARRAARYYLARDPAMSVLRVVDIDQWAFAGCLLGAGSALLAVRRIAAPAWVAWALIAASLVLSVPPTVRWLRARRRGRRA